MKIFFILTILCAAPSAYSMEPLPLLMPTEPTNTAERTSSMEKLPPILPTAHAYMAASRAIKNFNTELVTTYVNSDPALVHFAQPSSKTTLLMIAAERNNQDVCTFLLEHGANVHAKDSNGKTASIRAAEELKNFSRADYLFKLLACYGGENVKAVRNGYLSSEKLISIVIYLDHVQKERTGTNQNRY